MDPRLKYAGEGLFFLGIAYRLLRWVGSALLEGDAPPSAFPLPPAGVPGHHIGATEQVAHTLMAPRGEDGVVPPIWSRAATADPPPQLGDPALFPPEMLAAMTPEQRAKVLETLAKERGDR